MSRFGEVMEFLQRHDTLDQPDNVLAAEVIQRCPGWSGLAHFELFKALALTRPATVLVCGVYLGRDIGMLLQAHHRHGGGAGMRIDGVDLFSAEPCADWPEEARGKSWEEAGFGAAPDIARARVNISHFQQHSGEATLHQARAVEWMRGLADRSLDVVYLDTSHDRETVLEEIAEAKRITRPGGVICGDDYIERPTWGVIGAVRESLPVHYVLRGCIWLAEAKAP